MQGDGLVSLLVHCSQINLQYCRAATALLSRSLVVEHTDIYLIQEPWHHGGSVKGLSGSEEELFYARGDLDPRACIAVKKACGAKGMANFCYRDLVAVVMRLRGEAGAEDIVFCSAYFPHDSPTPPPTKELRDLVNHCRAKKLPLIIGCEANAQNVVWGSERCSDRGTALLEFMADVDLEILKRGSRPTFVTSRCQCLIDITVCTRRLVEQCMDWRVDRKDTLSDHRRIRFSIEGCTKLQEDRLEDEVERIHVALIESFQIACPAKRCRQGNKVPWWSQELDRLRSQSRRLGNRAHKSKRAEDWTLYRNVQREYKRLIKQSKELTWRTYCEELEALSSISRRRRVFSGGPAQRLGGITLTSAETITEPREVLEHLVCAHFPDSIIEHPGECPETDWTRTGSGDPDWGLAARIVTLDRLRWAVDSFEMYKSPGPDGIYPALLRRGGPLLLRRLLPALRGCLASGYVPSSLPGDQSELLLAEDAGKTGRLAHQGGGTAVKPDMLLTTCIPSWQINGDCVAPLARHNRKRKGKEGGHPRCLYRHRGSLRQYFR
ncbi:uncharacterized protein LOC135163956 [Diachasmimorpha longicaudata]|uniref:uncharacterized protein LOC135163956 n=1 Tax=Diachasmimorpha longicaudata TaxID=58733 RepID=UPI0030B902C8